jgi:hypothetical protein
MRQLGNPELQLMANGMIDSVKADLVSVFKEQEHQII